MKNFFSTILLIAALAATAKAQIAFEGGLNMASWVLKANGASAPTTFKLGGMFGFVADMALSDHVYFQPGVFYQMTGCKLSGQPAGGYDINTICVPLNIEYKSGEKCNPRFFAGAGPYIGYNISGTYTMESYGPIPSQSAEIKFGGKGGMKQTDIGLGVNTGYLFNKHFYARATYQMGLTNLNQSENKDNSIRTSNIAITIGYLFGSCNSGGSGNPFRVRGGNHWRGMSKGKYSRKHLPH